MIYLYLKAIMQNHDSITRFQPHVSSFKMVILGAARGIGQSLALLVEMSHVNFLTRLSSISLSTAFHQGAWYISPRLFFRRSV